MISGNLQDIAKLETYLAGNLAKAFALLKDIDFTDYANGDYPLDGDNIIAKVNTYNTEPQEQRAWEKHDKYIDIQLISAGTEKIGYADYQKSFLTTEDRMISDDVAFYKNVPEDNYVTLQTGEWAVFFPWEAHKPNCQSGSGPSFVKKVVVKVKKC